MPLYSNLVCTQSYKSNYTQTGKTRVVPAHDELQADDDRLQRDMTGLMQSFCHNNLQEKPKCTSRRIYFFELIESNLWTASHSLVFVPVVLTRICERFCIDKRLQQSRTEIIYLKGVVDG